MNSYKLFNESFLSFIKKDLKDLFERDEIDNLKRETINAQVKRLAGNATSIDTDDSTSYVD